MMNLNFQDVENDIKEVEDWAENEYQSYFAAHFVKEKEMYSKLKSASCPITDEELEWIITSLPLELFSAADRLTKLKLRQEVIKLHIKELATNRDLDETEKKNASNEDRFLINAYGTIIERVEREMSFSRELIMGAKKVWDARRANDPHPSIATGPDYNLPEYQLTYIKGGTNVLR